MAKIFEKVIHDHLYNYLNVNDLLTSCQSGFRSLDTLRSLPCWIQAITCVIVVKGLLNDVILIDLKKAFDTIGHKIILQKLAK